MQDKTYSGEDGGQRADGQDEQQNLPHCKRDIVGDHPVTKRAESNQSKPVMQRESEGQRPAEELTMGQGEPP